MSEETTDETTPKKKGGPRYTITAAAKAHERALAKLKKLQKGSKVEAAAARLEKAQAAYDKAVAESEGQTDDLASVEAEVEETRAALDAAYKGV